MAIRTFMLINLPVSEIIRRSLDDTTKALRSHGSARVLGRVMTSAFIPVGSVLTGDSQNTLEAYSLEYGNGCS